MMHHCRDWLTLIGGGGKAPANDHGHNTLVFTYLSIYPMVIGQKNLPMVTDTLSYAYGQWSIRNFKLTDLNTRISDFDSGHGQNLDYLTSDISKFRP